MLNGCRRWKYVKPIILAAITDVSRIFQGAEHKASHYQHNHGILNTSKSSRVYFHSSALICLSFFLAYRAFDKPKIHIMRTGAWDMNPADI